MIDVSQSDLATIKKVLKKHVPFAEIRAFGSRVSGKAKKHSDLDLAVVAKNPLPSFVLSLLKSGFEDSDLPFRVDILDWHTISDKFRSLILKKYEVIQKG